MALYRLQKAKAFHQNEIKALIRAARINPLGLDWRRFIVALADDGQLIGCGQVKTHRDDSRELASLVVATAWRGQGVARALIRRLLVDHPCPLWLTCTATLVPFYTRFGFGEITNTALMPAYFRRVNRLFRLFTHLSPSINRLAVMRCDADEL
jgi:amino-acid N-acetyltransferase